MADNYEDAPTVYHKHRLYPLTALQIGDIQSYISKLFLHTVHDEKKLVLIVDNSPWTAENQRSKPVEFWQLMVTQSRTSPFTNRSLRPAVGCMNSENAEEPDANAPEDSSVRERTARRKLFRRDQGHLVKLIRDLFQYRLKSVVSVQELKYLLHGCITFELEWANVRGINYINELQTDTCLALDTKLMMKRNFHSFEKALAFYGVKPEGEWHIWTRSAEAKSSTLLHNLQMENSQAQGFSTGSPDFSVLKQKQLCRDDRLSLSSVSGSSQKSNDIDSPAASTSFDGVALEDADCHAAPSCCHSDGAPSSETGSCFCTAAIGMNSVTEERLAMESMSLAFQSPGDIGRSGCLPEVEEDAMIADCCSNTDLPSRLYRDTLLLFRFCDPILPFELKNIITADQRLLKMLESGLPSWVIFLQSYPIICKVYRPWMLPFVRTLYVVISVVTVIIGFYDLYKNVPVLKATAARICGPLFDWIEAWEMVSRIKYLGTMLFLQNCEKTFRWLIMIFRTSRHLPVMLMKPMIEPLEELAEVLWPIWNACSDGILGFASLLWMVVSSLVEYMNSLVQLIIRPFAVLLTTVWKLGVLIWNECSDGILGFTSLLWMVVSSLVEYMNNLVQLIIWPFIVLLTTVWKLATWLLYPVFSALWGLVVLPIRLIVNIANLLVVLVCSIFTAAQDLWGFVSSSSHLISVAGPPATSMKAANSSVSSWRILWNDIFSQVFRAVRSILNGLVAFFTALNRHRLSIYNRTSAFVLRVAYLVKSAHSRISDACHHVLDTPLLNEGGFEDEDVCSCCNERRLKSSSMRLSLRETCRKGILADACLNCASMALQKAKVE